MKHLRLILWIISIPIFFNCYWALNYPTDVQALFGLTEDQFSSQYLFISGLLMTLPLTLCCTGKYGVFTSFDPAPDDDLADELQSFFDDLDQAMYSTIAEQFPDPSHKIYQEFPGLWERAQATLAAEPKWYHIFFRNHPA